MPLSDAYALAGVENIRALHRVYKKEDQRLMKCREWDYENPALLTNQIKEILDTIDLNALTEEERKWCQEMLWFWHHHAISSAIWRQKSRSDACFHAAEALRYQDEYHPNQITRLLYLLVHDKLLEAKVWAEQIKDEVEKQTAAELLQEYKAGEFFSNTRQELAMKLTFFLKYPEYKKGLRLIIDGHTFVISYNKTREPEDDFFDGSFDSLTKFQARLKECFGGEQGERWFTHLFQHLFQYHMRRIRKKRKYI
ncbi:MAG: hypothetical protein ABSE76_00235 [Minisyncoccia bacterium]|jgi:hypothetical protein